MWQIESLQQKKITVSFFINKKVKGRGYKKDKLSYPLYIRVIYNRKNIHMRSKLGGYYSALNEVPPQLLDFEEKAISRIMEMEIKYREDDFTLKGLSFIYEIYTITLEQALEDYLKPRLVEYICSMKSRLKEVLDLETSEATVELLYEASKRLFRNEFRVTGELQRDLLLFKRFQSLQFLNVGSPYPLMIIDWMEEGKCDYLKTDKAMETFISHAILEKTVLLGDD